MKIRSIATLASLAALGAMVMGPASMAVAEEMIITSEIAPTHWKAQQLDELAADITKRTDGRIEAETYHAGTLYKDKDAMTALGTGAVQMVWPVSNWLETVNPAYGIINLPFAIDDQIMQDAECRAGLTKLMSSLVEDKGLKVLGLARTSVGIFLSKSPITSVDDLKNQTIRVPSGKINQALMNAFGANPISMATTEIATALAQGAVDVVFTSPGGWQMVGPIAKYASIIPSYSLYTYSVLVDKNWLNGLSERDRDAVLAATAAAMERQWPEAMKESRKALDAMVAKGGQVIHIGEEETKEFERRAQPVINNFRKEHPVVAAKYDEIIERCR